LVPESSELTVPADRQGAASGATQNSNCTTTKGVARLRLARESVKVEGDEYDPDSLARSGHNHNKRNAEMVGGRTGGEPCWAVVRAH
jgi:hypothetical protein